MEMAEYTAKLTLCANSTPSPRARCTLLQESFIATGQYIMLNRSIVLLLISYQIKLYEKGKSRKNKKRTGDDNPQIIYFIEIYLRLST